MKSYDPYATMEKSDKSLHHVVDKVERFEKDNNHHQFTPPSGWDLDNAERRKEQVEKQLEKVRAWCKKDRTIPIMTVFGDFTYQWLVPLPLSTLQETPTLVAVLHPTRTDESDQPCYILKTVLTLDMALMQARLCGKIHQKWTVSKRQSEALRKVEEAALRIPKVPGVDRGVRELLDAIKSYKQIIMRYLPSVATVEDCNEDCKLHRINRSIRPVSEASASAASEDERGSVWPERSCVNSQILGPSHAWILRSQPDLCTVCSTTGTGMAG